MLIETIIAVLAVCALALWLAVLLLPWGPWRNREVLEKLEDGALLRSPRVEDLQDITVVIPARNEAALIQGTLAGLAGQIRTDKSPDLLSNLRVVLVDDCSEDGTAELARQVPGVCLTVVRGQALPPGWAGKLWALEQGVRCVTTRYTLFLDADIRLQPGVVPALRRHSERNQRPFVSVMATLPMRSFWEKLLTPAFIYFFKMLYPFALANSARPQFASAAGGCILLETQLLERIGGLESIRGALIDDCTLAARVKRLGFRTWTGQSRLVVSARGYAGLSEIWNMVARSAFTQLRYSTLLLLFTSSGLIALFWGPILGLLSSQPWVRLAGLAAFLAMALTYLPTLQFYAIHPLWAALLPFSATLYLGMTWTSALRYWGGVRSRWKDRIY